jgi:hypothetical protein
VLESFRVARYNFTIEAVEELHLPANRGSTLRGGFGHALRRLTCLHQDRRRCRGCDHHQDCVYGYIFETAPPRDAEVLTNLRAIPLPFVVRTQRDRSKTVGRGDHLEFELVLIGRARAYLPYFILGFKELGRLGLGRDRGKYILQRVLARHPWNGHEEMVFDGVDVQVREDCWSVSYREVADRAEMLPTDRLDIAFITPTRLKYHGELTWHGPPFHVLIRRLLDRISSLSYFHCGERWDIDFKGWIEQAKEIQATEVATSWTDWERYSGRQDQRVKMGGLVGPITYTGNLALFRGLLALGTLVHVGKGTVMGNGRFAVKGLDSDSRL